MARMARHPQRGAGDFGVMPPNPKKLNPMNHIIDCEFHGPGLPKSSYKLIAWMSALSYSFIGARFSVLLCVIILHTQGHCS